MYTTFGAVRKISTIGQKYHTVEFAQFVTSRGLEKSDDLGEVPNNANW